MLVANKCDLEDRRVVRTADGENLAEALNAHFMETSSVKNTGINEVKIETGRRGECMCVVGGGGRGGAHRVWGNVFRCPSGID